MKSSTDVPTQRAEPDALLDTSAGVAPVRLLAGGGSAFEQRLLQSAGSDRIPGASREQLARALNVAAPAAPALLGRLLRPLLGKSAAFAGLGALVLVGGWAARQWVSPAPAEPVEPALERPVVDERVVAAPLAGTPHVASSALPELAVLRPAAEPAASAPVARPLGAPSKPQQRSRPKSTPTRAAGIADAHGPTAQGGLSEELRALEGIQTLVRAGRANEAERALREYARRFPNGELGLEAELLGLDVSLARGQHEHTRQRVRELRARPGAASYRDRLDAIGSAASGADAAALGSESTKRPHSGAEATE